MGTLIKRGVLIDVAALRGVDMLPDTYEITVGDLEQALQRQNQKLQPGDAVIIHSGWGKLWAKDNARRTRILKSRYRSTRSCSWSTGSICWKT